MAKSLMYGTCYTEAFRDLVIKRKEYRYLVSYSRWSNSAWYVFWNSKSGDTKNEQVLSVWYSVVEEGMHDFTYAELKKMTPRIFRNYYKDMSDEEEQEVWKYITEWLDDMDRVFENA